MKTPAAILVEQRQPLVLDEVEIPTLGFGQVLVDTLQARGPLSPDRQSQEAARFRLRATATALALRWPAELPKQLR